MRSLPLLLMVLTSSLLSTTASSQERIYLANDDHTDYFWTLDDVGYRAAFQDMISFYLDQAEQSASNDDNARGRFNLDGSLWVYEWEHNQPQAQMDRLMAHIQSGEISMQLHSLVLLGGAMPTEAVIRDMMYAGRLERRYGVDVDLAVMMENQTLAGGLASLWAGAGAKYSWRGVCNCATEITGLSSPRAREIYRFLGHDGQGVLMKWNSIVSTNQSIGGYAEAADPGGAALVLENDPGFNARWPFPVKAAFGYGGDDAESTTGDFITAAQTLSDANHTVIVSNERDFFLDFTSSVDVANQVPLFVGSMGNEWDLNTASLAAVTAAMRRSIEKLRTAEALSVIVGRADPAFLDGRFDGTDEDRELAQLHMGMFYDHDWTADSPLHDAREQFQRDTVAQVQTYVDGLTSDALAHLGELAPAVPGQTRYIVANPLGTFVGAAVELPGQAQPFSAVDLGTGFPCPTQIVVDDEGVSHGIVSVYVPALGYTTVQVTSPPAGAAPADLCTIVNEADGAITMSDTHVVVTVQPTGVISSLVNLHDDNQLAGAGLFSFEHSSLGADDPAGTLVLEHSGPARCTVRVDVPSTPPRTVRVTLEGFDRVDVEETINGNFGDTAGYVLDLSSLPGLSVRHEETGMIALAKRVQNGGDYADEDARTDFLTLNHFVDVGNAEFGFAISSAESSFMKLGTSDASTLDEHPSSLFLVVGRQPDAGLGFANQGGDALFVNHYSIMPRDSDYDGQLDLVNALVHQNPPVAVLASGTAAAPLSALSEALFDVVGAAPWWVKPADDGVADGVIVRVWNANENGQNVIIRGPIARASRTSHIETDLPDLPQPVLTNVLTQALAPDQLVTYRMFLGSEGEGEGSAEGEGAAEGEGGEGEGSRAQNVDDARGCSCASISDAPHTPHVPLAFIGAWTCLLVVVRRTTLRPSK